MPFIHTRVNRPISKETEQELTKALGQAIALIPGKSESWLMLQFEENCHLYFRGNGENAMAFVNVKLFGAASPAAYEKLTAKITEILGEKMQIASDHIYVQYDEINHWGWNGSNF